MRKYFLLTALVLVAISNEGFSQVGSAAKVARDTIYTLTRDTLVTSVTSISSIKIFYLDLDSNNVQKEIARKMVQKIIYSDGKVEVYNKPVFSNIAQTDWRSIIITDKESDVEGLYLRAIIMAKSTSNVSTAIGAKTSAETTAKKKAAYNGGMYVLVKNRKELGGYGETPKYYIEGEVYGTKPLENGQKMKDEVNKAKEKKPVL